MMLQLGTVFKHETILLHLLKKENVPMVCALVNTKAK